VRDQGDAIVGAAEFEGAAELEALRLDQHAAADRLVEQRRFEQRSREGAAGEPLRRLLDVADGGKLSPYCGGLASSSAPPSPGVSSRLSSACWVGSATGSLRQASRHQAEAAGGTAAAWLTSGEPSRRR